MVVAIIAFSANGFGGGGRNALAAPMTEESDAIDKADVYKRQQVMMMQAALRDDCETFEKLNGMECMECGSCTYICPAKRPLTQAFKEMRKTVAANRRKKG